MKIGVITMQKNEGDLLDMWIKYHSAIFGVSSLIVLDNNSSDLRTENVLGKLTEDGGLVKRGYNDFEKKGQYVSDALRTFADDFDWIFLTDADEFVFHRRQLTNPLHSRLIIEELLSTVPADKALYRIDSALWNIPYTNNTYPARAKKIALRRGFRPDIDLGFHLFSDRELIDKNLVYSGDIEHLHFHNRYFYDVLKLARLKLSARVRDFSKETLLNYSGAGSHLIKYFQMSEIEYIGGFLQKSNIIDISNLFNTIGVEIPYSK
ncbi:glycosyltransferase family 2 protein [Methylobacterium sp. J-078]|uniref:glycosyltransferase family 2 protein n=1 Tax=Methylobacterium sp. J-078 TaxID=2836657 RepID=UPI001FBC04E4|nr:glycosyltransferase family 2 protein [Methylobacterium sp. J-078]MCJ2045786.1 glycosyltransferase family 2 protein [Methylobacterium sp. J-078]